MKGCWLTFATVIIGLTGCASTPNREMKQAQVEEFSIPPAKYDAPPDYPRDDRGFMPKSGGMPMNMGGVGQGGTPGLPGGPGGGSGSMGGSRR
jgi:hypothetical protein